MWGVIGCSSSKAFVKISLVSTAAMHKSTSEFFFAPGPKILFQQHRSFTSLRVSASDFRLAPDPDIALHRIKRRNGQCQTFDVLPVHRVGHDPRWRRSHFDCIGLVMKPK